MHRNVCKDFFLVQGARKSRGSLYLVRRVDEFTAPKRAAAAERIAAARKSTANSCVGRPRFGRGDCEIVI